MPDLPPLRYSRPTDLPAALAAIARPGACIYAGGTDLLVALGERRPWTRFVRELVDVKQLAEARGITRHAGGLRLGALTTAAELAVHAGVRRHAPALAEAAGLTSAPALRGRGTLAGNLVTPHPASDVATALLALGAVVEVMDGDGLRTLPLPDFMAAQAAAWPRQQLVLAVRVARAARSAFEKIADRAAFGRSLVAVATVAGRDETRVAFGGLAARPFLAGRTAAAVRSGTAILPALATESRPPANGREAHRLHLAVVLLDRALTRVRA